MNEYDNTATLLEQLKIAINLGAPVDIGFLGALERNGTWVLFQVTIH